MIVGIDEVGRGAWAGPLCVAAVALGETTIEGLTDSKLLSLKRRIAYAKQIRQSAALIGIGWVHAKDIDEIGLSKALQLATSRAFSQIDCPEISQIIIDGTVKFIDDPRVVTMKQADLIVPSVSAASIIAKVARDDYMKIIDGLFPEYGFSRHVGYGTKQHRDSIEKFGTTSLHRQSFQPMAGLAESRPSPEKVKPSSGAYAEVEAARYLQSKGYTIIAQNWKTKRCEIDIIASKDSEIYFVEVKYRLVGDQGGGIAAITSKKLRQMQYAATIWLQKYGNQDAHISVIEVSGLDFEVSSFIVSVTR